MNRPLTVWQSIQRDADFVSVSQTERRLLLTPDMVNLLNAAFAREGQQITDSNCKYATLAGMPCRKCGRIHNGDRLTLSA